MIISYCQIFVPQFQKYFYSGVALRQKRQRITWVFIKVWLDELHLNNRIKPSICKCLGGRTKPPNLHKYLAVVGYLIDLSKSLKSDFNAAFIFFFSAALNSTGLPLPFLPLILCLWLLMCGRYSRKKVSAFM